MSSIAYKQPLHGFVARLGWDDVYAGVRLLIATFIALPLLPNEPIDPWDALNPYKLWLLVVLISSLSLQNGIEVVAIHSHMLQEQPRLFFVHFWANDDAVKLANGLKAALSKMAIAHT
jgi:hypothetical protein